MKNFCIFILATVFYCASAQVNLTSSLVACYALNGNTNEPINNLTGTLTGVSATANRFNTANSAISFAGSTTSMVQLPASSLLKPNAISVSGWYKADQLPNRMTIIFAKNIFGSFHTAYGLALEYVNNTPVFRAVRQNGSGTDFADGTTSIAQNTWYHVVMTIDNNNTQIFVNGALEGSVSNSINGFNYDMSKPVILGGTNELADNPFYFGAIDNLRFYSRVLNAAEVSALYIQDPNCVNEPAPVANFFSSKLTVCKGQPVSLTDQSSNAPTSWSWNMTGGTPAASTVNNPVVQYANPGTYTITLTATNAGGSSTATKTISVLSCVGVSEATETGFQIQVFPNPVKNLLHVISKGNEITRIRLTDLSGKILSDELPKDPFYNEISLERLDDGYYLLEVFNGNDKTTKKIIKQ